MNDLEIVKLCAQAMGLELVKRPDHAITDPNSTVYYLAERFSTIYRPLHDDAQAMAMVRKFGLCVYHDLLRPNEPWDIEYEVLREGPEGERYPIKTVATAQGADLLRTICLCVAAPQSSKPEGAK